MKRTIAGGLLAAVTLFGGLAFTSGATQATRGEDHKQSVCHPVEGRGETGNGWNIIPPDKASSHIDEETGDGKHTRKDGRTDVFAVDGKCPGPEIPEWTEPQYPPFNPQPCTEYRLEKKTSTWDADTGTWSAWTDWPGAGPLDWGQMPAERTGHHGGEHKKDGDRHFAYVAVAERAVTTGECEPTTTTQPPVTTLPPETTLPPVTTLPPETTQPPVTTAPPTTQPPATTTTTVPPVITTTVPPTIPPTVAPTLPPPPPPAAPTELPKTGAETWYMALIGLLMLAGGSGLIYATRRS